MAAAALAAVVAGAHAGTLVENLAAVGAAAGAAATGLEAAEELSATAEPNVSVNITQVGGGERLRKSALVVVRVRVRSSSAGGTDRPCTEGSLPASEDDAPALRMARTMVVGFDTLAADALAGDRAVRALGAATGATRADTTIAAIRSAVRSVASDASVHVERRPGSSPNETPANLAAGEVVYLEVSTGGVVLGDTIRVAAHHGEPVGAFALRLWL